MAIFTYIATAIVTAIGSVAGVTLFTAGALTTAGTIATSLIAGGLGYITAKVTGVMKTPNIQAQKDPGVKVQLSPSTDRRVPVFYGKIHTGGLIVDAEIKNQNNTMVYCMVIGEKTDAGAFTVQSIKRQDATLNFGFNSPNVTSVTDPNGTARNNIANKMRCRVFAGNAQSSVNQIFPAGGTKVAAQSLMSTITASTNYEDLVYAIFEIDYDAEEGLTTLGTITYEITNSLSEPSNVLLDYCTNTRYGAGLSNAELDLNSFNSVHDYSTDQVAFTNVGGGAGTHDRWKIDGVLSTYQTVKDNIDQLCQSCATFFTYDNKQGKFTLVPNRAATTAEKNAAFIFDDQNIITSIEITSTELYSLYNEVEVEYPSVAQEDQTKLIVISTPSGDRNTNEPDNSLGTRFNMVNDAPRVHNLANIDLRQSRKSMTVSFSADYSALTVDVGDIVKVTNALYGFDSKLFRVMKVSEVESDSGYISAKVVLLEYADSVYEHNTVQSDGALGLSGIPNWWTTYGNLDVSNLIANINIVDSPATNTGNILHANGVVQTPNVALSTINVPVFGGIGTSFIDYGITIPANIVADTIEVVTTNEDIPNTTPSLHVVKSVDVGQGDHFTPGETIRVPIVSERFGINEYYDIERRPEEGNIKGTVRLRDSKTGAVSPEKESGTFFIKPQGSVTPQSLRDIGAGVQIEDRPSNNSSVVSSNLGQNDLGSAGSKITNTFPYDLKGIDEGDYSIIASGQVGGQMPASGSFNYSFGHGGDVLYEQRYLANNALQGNTYIQSFGFGGGSPGGGPGGVGFQIIGQTSAPPPSVSTEKINISDASARAIVTSLGQPTTGFIYTPKEANVILYGNTNIDSAVGVDRSFSNLKFDMIRITKGDRFLTF